IEDIIRAAKRACYRSK
ncbi:hypothetical protein CARUB_v100266330mg, partial [Capsella rubella]